jgi:DNA polymerase-3 subunit delta'
VLAELDRHPHARAVLGPALARPPRPSHAYLFHGPGGAGKRAAARALAAELLCEGAPDVDNARARVRHGTHPDLTWVVPSGAHEMLVSDIDEPVIAAASKTPFDGPVILAASRTPFESARRVFVIERADELGDEAANRMLKTLEEPASFVHIILLTDRLTEVLPTIRSRCQTVRFEARTEEQAVAVMSELGISGDEALACVRLALQDAERAGELASAEGRALRAAAEAYARAAVAGTMSASRPWAPMLSAARARGEVAGVALDAEQAAELELVGRRDRRRVQTEWTDRIRRTRRRVQTGALDLGLQLVSLWFADLAALALEAPDLVRNVDRLGELGEDHGRGAAPGRLRDAVELVEETRRRFELNVSEELACEALAYRLEQVLAR